MRLTVVNTGALLLVFIASAVTGCRPYKGPPVGAATAVEENRVPPSGLGTRTVTKLPNGLRLVLEENHAAPLVAIQAWVHAGSADDPLGQEGLAHIFQHLLFMSTKARPAAQVSREIAAIGGRMGAFTTTDDTVFQTVVASPFVDVGLGLLSDVLSQPTLTPADLEVARRAARDDLRQARAIPERVAAQAALTTAFSSHPYARSLLGTESSLAAIGGEQVRWFFDRFYVAANSTLIIVGDFDAALIQAQVSAAFGNWRAGTRTPARPAPTEPRSAQVTVATADVPAPQLAVAFRIPSQRLAELPSVALLAALLGPGRGGRLESELVRNRQLVTDTRAQLFEGRDAALLITTSVLGPGRVDEALRAVRDEVARLSRDPIGAEELARARGLIEGDSARERSALGGYARNLGLSMAVAGDPSFRADYLARLHKVDSDDLKAVAAGIFQPQNLVVAAILPAARDPQRDDRAAKLLPRLQSLASTWEVQAPAVNAAGPVSPSGRDVVDYSLPSGVRLLVLRDDTSPQVSVRAVWSGGVRFEEPRLSGATSMLARLLPRATKTRASDQMAKDLADAAGTLEGVAAMDTLGVRGDFLASHWEPALDLVFDCIRNPKLAEDDVERERRVLLDAVRTRDDDPTELALRAFQGALFGRHPYRQDLLGTADSVAGLSRRRLLDHYRRHYGLRGLTVAVLGPVEPDRIAGKMQALLADAPATPAERDIPAAIPQSPATEPRQAFQLIAKPQARVVIGYPGVTVRDPDRFALEVLAEILGGDGQNAATGLRDQLSPLGAVQAVAQAGVDPGYFAVYLAVRPEDVDAVVPVLRAQLQRVTEAAASEQDVARARRILIGTRALALERRGAVAMALALHGALGETGRSYRRDIAELAKVTAADVTRAARRVIDPRREVLAIVRPRTSNDRTTTSLDAPGPRYTAR